MIVFHLHLCLHQFHRRDNGCLRGKNCLYRNPKKHFLVDILDFEFLSLNLNIGVEYTPPPLA